MLKWHKLFLIGLLTTSLLFNAYIFWHRSPKMEFHDFIIFYTGAQILIDRESENLYNLDLQSSYQERLNFRTAFSPTGILPYNHPPYELLLFVPLVFAPYQTAYFLWFALNVLLIILICKLLSMYFPPENRFVLTAVVFTFTPTWIAFLRGQDSIMSLLLLTGGFLNLKMGRESVAGCLLGLGLYKPQLVIPIATMFFVKLRWKFIRAFVCTGLLLTILSCAIIGWNGVAEYLQFLSWINQKHYTVFAKHMANIHGFVETILGLQHPGTTSSAVIAAISIALYAWCIRLWRGDWQPSQSEFDLKFSHLVLITLLISYHAYTYDLISVSLAIVLALGYSSCKQNDSARFLTPILILSTGFCFPLILHVIDETKKTAWISLLILLFALVLWKELATRNRVSATRHR